MVIDRRTLLLSTAVIAATAPGASLAREQPSTLHAGTRRGPDGRYSAAIFAPDGTDVRAVDLGGRGHDIAVCPVTGRCVVFARRPGTFAVAFSVQRERRPVTFEARADRHFYGHGVFSADGRLLYATENDFEAGRGAIGIYDVAAGFRRIGEFASHGIGPHDLALMEGGRVLVVANGGLREHPDFGDGRRILNADSFETGLCYIDTRNGDLLELHALPTGGRLSLRHLDIGKDGTVVLGAQMVGGAPGRRGESLALVYRHKRQTRLSAVPLTIALEASLAGYVSSIAVDANGEIAAITSSKSGTVLLMEIATGHIRRSHHLVDVSGVSGTSTPGTFLLTSGAGTVARTRPSPEQDLDGTQSPWSWDNHIARVRI